MKTKSYFIAAILVFCGVLFWFSETGLIQSKASPTINLNPIMPRANQRMVAAATKSERHSRRKDTVLVKIKSDASKSELMALDQVYQELGLGDDKAFNQKSRRLKISNPLFLDQEEAVVERLRALSAVQFAEPDYFIQPALLPNDVLFSSQWHLPKINAPDAWNISKGDPSVVVAMCDAGFDLNHPDLAANFLLPGYNTVLNNSQIDNLNDHGTLTSGAVAAIGNNNQGIAGVAWQVKILPIQVSNVADGTSSYSDIADCIYYANSRGAKVINISYDSTFTSALISDAASVFRTGGGVVVVSAGNSTMDLSAWGPSPHLIVVAASDYQDNLTYFSNFGSPVDLKAPGLDILTTSSGGNYASVSGTSLSAPLVAGTAALIYSINSQFTSTQVENFILTSLQKATLPLGRIDVSSSLQSANAAAIAGASVTLDNLGPNLSDGLRTFTGKWCQFNSINNFESPSLTSCMRKLSTYRFTPFISKKGVYAISIRYAKNSALSSKVPVIVKSATGSTTQTINMQINQNTWVPVGNFNLIDGTGNYLEINNSSGNANIDGVSFQFVN